jgi:hypothetical protein
MRKAMEAVTPGDPAATRGPVLELVDADDPPLRVLLGNGLLGMITADYEVRLATWRQVEDEAYERVWERVAAVDVAKATGVVCTRVPGDGPSGRRSMHVWTVSATMNAVTELGDHLRCQGTEVVTVGSVWRLRSFRVKKTREEFRVSYRWDVSVRLRPW